MPRICSPIHAASAALACLMLALAGCKSNPPSPHEKDKIELSKGAIRMPSGVYLGGLQTIDQAARTKLYVSMESIGDPSNPKLLFPPEMAQAVGLSNRQMNRNLMDTILASRRFDVLEMGNSVTAEASSFQVAAMVKDAWQSLEPLEGGRRVAVTRVLLSLQIKDLYTGELLQDRAISVEGQSGQSSGDRTVLGPQDKPNLPQVQQALANDYKKAMHRAFKEATLRIQEVFRPLGKVVSLDGDTMGLFGGIRQGFQGKDELVVFRVRTMRLPNGKEEITSTIPVAAVRCDGVGSNTSQCDIIRKHPQHQVQPGDYAVLSEYSKDNGARME